METMTLVIREITKEESIDNLIYYTDKLVNSKWYDFEKKKHYKRQIKENLINI